MAKVDKKRVITAALIGGAIFSGVVVVFDYFLGRGFSLQRFLFYLIFGILLYGFLTYRNFKKHNSNK